MSGFEDACRLAAKCTEKLKREKNVVSIIQIGSSLRKEDFNPDSDIDFLVIYANPVRKSMLFGEMEGTETNMMRYGKKQFVHSLEDGTPIDLIALRFGKVLYDKVGFFAGLKKRGYRHTGNTIKKWIRTGNFNLGDAAMSYAFPACMCCYFKALHHAAREFSRAIILREGDMLVEGNDAILNRLKESHPELSKKFRLIIEGRRHYERFEHEYMKHPTIKNSGLGKYLLAAECIAIESLRITSGLNVPPANELISKLQKKYDIDHYHSFRIEPEHKDVMLNLVLRGDKLAFFRYSLEKRDFIDETVIKGK